MRRSSDMVQKAADLRSRGISAARSGRVEEAWAAFLESLEYDPHNASVFLWLAGIAPSKREAYQFLDRARRLDPDHPQLTWVAEDIHQRLAKGARRVRTTPHIAGGLLGGAADVLLRFAGRLLSIPILLVALVFLVALAVDLGQEGNLPSAVPSAAGFTADYLKGLARGDLGVIASGHRAIAGTPVADDLGRALPKSLGLLAFALTLAALVGLILGISAALRRAGNLSKLLLFASVLGISTPSFFAAMLLIWLSVRLYQTTSKHLLPISGFGWDLHLILPGLVLAARPAAAVTRLSYNALVEILESDYVRTAVAKGLRPRLILLRHVLRNAGVPILTTVGVSLRFSLAVLPIVEYIFNWPGIGLRLLKAIQAQDTTTVVGMILPLILLFVLVNLLLEMLYPLVDPRLRASEVGTV